jgi:membrane-bound lytic murein transglycosylase D
MRRYARFLPLLLSMLLAACTGMPSHGPRPSSVESLPAPAASPEAAPPPAEQGAPSPAADVWERLRSSFAMPGCDADPTVLAWARRYTRHPRQFESQLQAVMPRLVYVQQVADRYDVAGEFVLLPWVESHFQPVPARRRRPAGMWQIMPVMAGAMGLRVDGHYDGRLDVPAAANAVMKLLEQYHEQFHDWRVADYAYNAGEFTIRKMVQAHGMPAAQPAIPQWPVRKVTREHLAKLLGMACVVREPERFSVSLPTLPDEQQLVQTGISHSMPITRAADHAGMSVEALKLLNPAFRNNTIDASAAPYLILPARHARQFRDALLEQADSAGGDLLASASRGDTAPSPMPAASPPRKVHTVKRGDSLWQIARKYSVGVGQLQHWNHLNGHALKPGQTLTVGAPD